jgi:hypothetical protein
MASVSIKEKMGHHKKLILRKKQDNKRNRFSHKSHVSKDGNYDNNE